MVALACSPNSGDGSPGSKIQEPRDPGTGGAPSTPAPGSTGGGFNHIPDSGPLADAPLYADSGCESVHDTRPHAPNALIVLDRSRSMALEGVDRWNPSVAAINDLTQSLESQIRFGLMTFPEVDDGCGAGELRVNPALNQAAQIKASLAGDPATLVGGGTPTSATLLLAQTTLASLSGTSYVILVTDGAPNCNPGAPAATCTCTRSPAEFCTGGDLGTGAVAPEEPLLCLDDDETVAAIQSLAAAGIATFVIGYDTGEWSAALDRMAAAGNSGRATHFPVSDRTSLAQALEGVSAYVVSCTFELSVAPPNPRYVSVALDGTRVRYTDNPSAPNGWTLRDGKFVDLLGSTCNAVRDGEPHDVVVVRECEEVVQ